MLIFHEESMIDTGVRNDHGLQEQGAALLILQGIVFVHEE